ncbi:MAG: ABC transporter permease [Brevefilum sp.]|nr:ABC transporter permease [Brevefilum sp.]
MKKFLVEFWKSYSIVIVVIVIGLVLGLLAPRFLTKDNLINVMTNASLVAIVGLGMTLAIASGNFDLSVGATASFAGCISFSLVPILGVPLSIIAGVIVGAVVGLINGLIISELRVPAFIATLSMMTIVRGFTLIFTNGRDLYLFGQTEYKILSGQLILGISTPIFFAIGIALLFGFVKKYTRFGRHILAMGGNLSAASRSGVRTSFVLWGIFSIVGATAALTGMIISSQVLTANARLATGLELSAIAVVILGGTALSGGQATVIGTLLGALLISMINNGLNLLNVPIFYQELTVGALMLGALAVKMQKGFKISSLLRSRS